MKKLLTNDEFKRMTEEYNKVKHTCKCGHRVVVPAWEEKSLCGYCGKYVFKDKKTEFEYRMQEKLKRR